MTYFARLVDTYMANQYGVSPNQVPDGPFSRPTYLEKCFNVWESSPKRILSLIAENKQHFSGDIGRVLLLEVKWRAKKQEMDEGYVCLFDANSTELIQRKRERRQHKERELYEFGEVLKLPRILGVGLGGFITDETPPTWEAMLHGKIKLVRYTALGLAEGCFSGKVIDMMQSISSGEPNK
jgi:hypothetical protein